MVNVRSSVEKNCMHVNFNRLETCLSDSGCTFIDGYNMALILAVQQSEICNQFLGKMGLEFPTFLLIC